MKIETKYNIGQEVWFTIGSCHVNGTINEIYIYIFRNSRKIIYGIEYKNYIGYSQKEESELFPTKEELIKSL